MRGKAGKHRVFIAGLTLDCHPDLLSSETWQLKHCLLDFRLSITRDRSLRDFGVRCGGVRSENLVPSGRQRAFSGHTQKCPSRPHASNRKICLRIAARARTWLAAGCLLVNFQRTAVGQACAAREELHCVQAKHSKVVAQKSRRIMGGC